MALEHRTSAEARVEGRRGVAQKGGVIARIAQRRAGAHEPVWSRRRAGAAEDPGRADQAGQRPSSAPGADRRKPTPGSVMM
jgi:hypothetical protein